MDINSQAKAKVLQEIMDLMDEKMSDGLKSKSPKFMKLEVESTKPLDEEEKLEAPDLEIEGPSEEDDDLERLKELYSKLK